MADENELGFTLENYFYDWLLIGTGVEECMFAAHLSKIARDKVSIIKNFFFFFKLLVLDLSTAYSNNTRTMNFREFHNFNQTINSQNVKEGLLSKAPRFKRIMDFTEMNEEFANRINQTSNFKFFNIDLQPKLLYSTSDTVEIMQ